MRTIRTLRDGRRSRIILTTQLTAASLALTALAAHPAHAAPPGSQPVAKAFRDGRAIPVQDALGACRGGNCSFRVTGGPVEYLAAVTNVGSAVINCTNEDIDVQRTVTLTTTTTDNIEGQISGRSTIEGSVENQAEVTVTAEKKESVTQTTTEKTSKTSTDTTEVNSTLTGTQTNTNSNTFHGAPKDEGPNTETTTSSESQTQAQNSVTNTAQNSVAKEAENQPSTTTEATGTVQARDQLTVGVRAAFEAAFQLTAGTSLEMGSTETMSYTTTLKPKDILTFSAQNAMVRTNGTLNVNDDSGAITVENITVDSPSTVNASNLIAQTFTAADQCETLRPTQDAADPQPTQPDTAPRTMSRGVPAPLPAGIHEIEPPGPDLHPHSTKILAPTPYGGA
ncbi:hypothetical protein [Streptomyces sp. C10-9-1]|uniref:hypothetical protein n=1 Tax=Streptomyces sp. C10-9-1 TaxID=1859285 RepID=UPI003D71AA18